MTSTYYEESYPTTLWAPADLGSLNPISVVVNTPTPVTITGTGFTPSSRVMVDGDIYPTQYISPTQLRFIAQGDSVGTQNVSVLNGGTNSDTLILGVTATGRASEAPSKPPEAPTEPPEAPTEPAAPDDPSPAAEGS